MSFGTGTRFGPYEVTGRIGAGGMGEVYRATDTKLGREVAIKTLPAALAEDKDRLARFEREARLLATLNHPHIAAVYGLDSHEGTLYLAMELVEGQTLERRLQDGALPVDEALPLVLQIAAALEAAHEQGVIHRDLKPANIMLTPSGQVKVLDFGLAKAFSKDPAEGSPTHSPALSLAMTQQGIILGTAGYMSPEQASGQPTDQRADIWAFGVVVYEMLTGLPLFSGESVPHVLADVLKSEPNWGRLPQDLHPRLKLMLERCLTKKPRNRYHSIADVRVDIEKVLGDPTGSTFPSVTSPAATASAPKASRLRFAAAMIVAGAVMAGLGVWYLKPAPPPEPKPVFRVMETLSATTFPDVPVDSMIAISPDGQQFLYRQQLGGGIYVRSLDDTEARLIPGTTAFGGVGAPQFSADGDSLLFRTDDGQLQRLPIAGGSPVAIADGVAPWGFDWTEDGNILYSTSSEIRQISENGGDAATLATVGEQIHRPQRLPRGDWILYVIMRSRDGSFEQSELVVESPSTGERRILRSAVTDARYLATGHIVYGFDGVLYAMPFDLDTLRVTGGPVPVLQGVASSVIGLHQFAVSNAGHLVYIPGLPGSATAQLQIAIADLNGELTPLPLPAAAYGHVRASPDGRWLAIDRSNPDEGSIIFLYELAGTSAMQRLTFDGNNRFPVWSPDSERVAFQSDRDGDAAIFVQRIDGAGGAERLTTPLDGELHIPESWSPDGRFLSFSVQGPGAMTLRILSLEDGAVTRFGTIESREPIGSVFSPDGNWLAYHAVPPGASQINSTSGIYVEPFPWTGARYQAPKVTRDFQPMWSPDGRAIRFIGSTASGQLVSVPVSTSSGVTFGSTVEVPFTLTAGRLSGTTRAFDTLPDGRFAGPFRGLAPEIAGATDIDPGSQIGIVLNWTEELKRLVPTE